MLQEAVKTFTKTFTEEPKTPTAPVKKEVTPVIKQKAEKQIKEHFEKQVKAIVEKKVKKPSVVVKTEIDENFKCTINGSDIKFFYSIDKLIIEDGRVTLIEMKTSEPKVQEVLNNMQMQAAFYLWGYEKAHGVVPESSKVMVIGTDKVICEVLPDPVRNILLEEHLSIFVDHFTNKKPFVALPTYHKCTNCKAKTYCPAEFMISKEVSEERMQNIEAQARNKFEDVVFYDSDRSEMNIYVDLVEKLKPHSNDKNFEYWEDIYQKQKDRLQKCDFDQEGTKELTKDLHNYLLQREFPEDTKKKQVQQQSKKQKGKQDQEDPFIHSKDRLTRRQRQQLRKQKKAAKIAANTIQETNEL